MTVDSNLILNLDLYPTAGNRIIEFVMQSCVFFTRFRRIHQSEWPLDDLTVNQLNKYLTAVDRMAQEFQNMKTTHSWINLITPAPVQVLHFSFRGLHERFEASTDDLRSPQYDGGEHDMFNIKDIWQTQAILFLKSLSERVGSGIERLMIFNDKSSGLPLKGTAFQKKTIS